MEYTCIIGLISHSIVVYCQKMDPDCLLAPPCIIINRQYYDAQILAWRHQLNYKNLRDFWIELDSLFFLEGTAFKMFIQRSDKKLNFFEFWQKQGGVFRNDNKKMCLLLSRENLCLVNAEIRLTPPVNVSIIAPSIRREYRLQRSVVIGMSKSALQIWLHERGLVKLIKKNDLKHEICKYFQL